MRNEGSNPFKDLKIQEEVPPDLKRKVMASVNFTQMMQEFAELFSVNMVRSVAELFNNRMTPKNSDNKDDKNDVAE